MENPSMSISELQSKELKKHEAAIRVSNNVGLLARKSWNVLLLNAYDELLSDKPYSIPVKVLSEIVGYNSESYVSLDEALKKLQTTLVEWDIGGSSEKKGRWKNNYRRSQMIGSIGIINGVIEYRFDNELSKMLYNPQVYQKIGMSQQRVFKSSSSMALWENCLRYSKVGSTGFSDIEEWREILGATAKTYDQFKFFKSKIILPAIKEINFLSNIYIELQIQKRGRKITKIGFTVMENPKQSLFGANTVDSAKESPEYNELLSYGISKIQALAWLQEHGFDYIKEKLNLLRKNEQLGTVKNPSGFLVKSIQQDFQDPEAAREAEKKRKAAERQQREHEREQREQAIGSLEAKFMKDFVREYSGNLSEDKQRELLEEIQSIPTIGERVKSLSDPMAIGLISLKITDFKELQSQYVKENLK